MTATVTVPGGAALQVYATPDTVRPYFGGKDTLLHDGGKTTPDWWSAYAAGARYGNRMTPKTSGQGKIIGILVMNPAESQSYRVGVYSWTSNAPGTNIYESGDISSSAGGWKYTDISSATVSVAGDFMVSAYFGTATTKFGADYGQNGRSYWMAQGFTTWNVFGYSLYLRAVVDYQGFIDTVKTVVVGNLGTSTDLTVTNITATQGWIYSISPKSFTLAPGAAQNVTVTFSRQSLSAGTYYDALSIASNDAECKVPVKFRVSGGVTNISPINSNLIKTGPVTIALYNAKGRLIRTINHVVDKVDYRTARWDNHDNYGQPVAAGFYFYTISSARGTTMKRMMIVR
jgi:hypothetical protein